MKFSVVSTFFLSSSFVLSNVGAAVIQKPIKIRNEPIETFLVSDNPHRDLQDDSICVKYTKAAFGEDTVDFELALVQAVVNLALLGSTDLGVPGILSQEGGLAPFFSGDAGPIANRGGTPTVINFLDGAANFPDIDISSNTFSLLSHLYQFFGALLGCTADGFPTYQGDPDMYRVHKFMGLDEDQIDFFNTQVGLSASALGLLDEDVSTVGAALDSLFNGRCTPTLTADSGVPAFMIGTQAGICTAPTCTVLDPNSCPPDAETLAPSPAGVMTTIAPTAAPSSSMVSNTPSITMTESAVADTLCVKYTKSVFGEDTAENELTLMETVVNLAVLGDDELNVTGILAAEGGLAPFFTGDAGATANRGDTPVSINFLDGAGDLPNPDPSSNTFNLLSHLYQFFGGLLGCTADGFPVYQGDPDMTRVHKFMGLDMNQLDFFNSQVASAASALGVEDNDVATIGLVLDSLFNMRCTPPLTADSGVPSFMIGTQSGICSAPTCPVADPSACPDSMIPTTAPIAATLPPAPTTMMEDTICIKYTKAVFGEDTAENELTLMETVVNLAVLGDADMNVSGILSPEGGLAPFFSGDAGPIANRGGTPVTLNFLDGAADLPNPSPTSNTFNLLAHLYQFFGALLGCTADGFPVYQGDPDMYRVHKFMNLDENQLGFFNTQVALAASALGVEDSDVATIGTVLDSLFNMQCTPPLTADSGVPTFLIGTQPGICTAPTCPVADPTACPDGGDSSSIGGGDSGGGPTSAPSAFRGNGAASSGAEDVKFASGRVLVGVVIATFVGILVGGLAVEMIL